MQVVFFYFFNLMKKIQKFDRYYEIGICIFLIHDDWIRVIIHLNVILFPGFHSHYPVIFQLMDFAGIDSGLFR